MGMITYLKPFILESVNLSNEIKMKKKRKVESDPVWAGD